MVATANEIKLHSISGTKHVGYNRMKFLLESIKDLDEQLKNLVGSGLWLLSGNPSEIIQKLHEKLGINKLCFEQDCEPIWKERDENVEKTCRKLGISVVEKVSHTLYDPIDVINANGGFSPLTYEMMLHTINVLGFPQRPVASVDFDGVNFGQIPENLYEELGVLRKVKNYSKNVLRPMK
jgi:cryptochrome